MDEWIEIEGQTKDEAIERACAALNTTFSYLKYEILSEGGKVKIRARRAEEDEVKKERSDVGKEAQEFLSEVIRYLDEDAIVDLVESHEEVRLDIQGNGSGLLIGKHGQTLEALQHLVAKASGLDRRETKRLVVDSEQYRSRRQEALEGLARKLAGRARRERRPVSVEPMNAMDRRVLHMALANHPHVSTKSVGEGNNRRVLVVPKGGSDRDDRNSRRGRGGPGRRDGGGRGPGRGRDGGGYGRDRDGNRERSSARRPGGPPRRHDSFDAPPAPNEDFFPDDMEAPLMADYANRTDPEASNFEENSELEETSFDEEDSSSDDTSEQ